MHRVKTCLAEVKHLNEENVCELLARCHNDRQNKHTGSLREDKQYKQNKKPEQVISMHGRLYAWL